jgi:vitamin B12 transporter
MESRSVSFSQWGDIRGNSRHDRWTRALYAHGFLEGKGWAASGGFRLDDNDQYGVFATYQLGASIRLGPTGARLRGNLGRGLKEPAFQEIHDTGFSVGNPDLHPERSLSWEVGLERPFPSLGVSASIGWYSQSMEDLIQYTATPPEQGAPNYFNVAKARTRGLEATMTLERGDAVLSAAYTYIDSKVLDAGFDEGPGAVFVQGEELIRRPRHLGTISLTRRFPRGTLGGDLRWIGARWDRDFSRWPSEPVRLPGHLLVGLGAELHLLPPGRRGPGVDLTFRGDNLLGTRHQDLFGFLAPGRSALVGLRFTFGG